MSFMQHLGNCQVLLEPVECEAGVAFVGLWENPPEIDVAAQTSNLHVEIPVYNDWLRLWKNHCSLYGDRNIYPKNYHPHHGDS